MGKKIAMLVLNHLYMILKENNVNYALVLMKLTKSLKIA